MKTVLGGTSVNTNPHTYTDVWSPVSSCDTGLFLEQSYVYS